MNEIDFETVLGELGCEMEKGEKGDNSQVDFMGDLIKRQRGCNIKNIKKHLIPQNYKTAKRNQTSLSNIIKTRNNRISLAAKQMLFGNICQTDQPSTPLVQLLEIKIATQHTTETFNLQNKCFKRDKIWIKLKEGSIYNASLKFVVYNDIVTGLRLVNNVSKLFVRVQEEDVLGSFGPRKGEQEVEIEEKQAPEGFFVRGDYKGKLVLIDSEGNVHCQLSYKLSITKN